MKSIENKYEATVSRQYDVTKQTVENSEFIGSAPKKKISHTQENQNVAILNMVPRNDFSSTSAENEADQCTYCNNYYV